jgi:hypothetical protein
MLLYSYIYQHTFRTYFSKGILHREVNVRRTFTELLAFDLLNVYLIGYGVSWESGVFRVWGEDPCNLQHRRTRGYVSLTSVLFGYYI